MGCNDKNKCVSPVSSSCVMYVGTKLLSVDESKLKCGITLTDVVETIDVEVNELQKHLNFKKLNKRCFSFDKSTVKQVELNQMFIDKFCDYDEIINKGDKDYISIVSNLILPIDCILTNCEGKNNRTLADLLKLFCIEIESLKRQVHTLQSQTNNNNIYIPNT